MLAPHPDDAVWSCGGMLRQWCREGTLTVVTVFDGDGHEGSVHRTGDRGGEGREGHGTPALRRAEDTAALAHWPLRAVGLGLPEAALRRDGAGRGLYAGPLALRRAPHPADAALTVRLAGLLGPLVEDHDEVLLPLAVRTHADHLLVREAAELALESRVDNSAPRPVRARYYREFPYEPPPPPGGYREHAEPADFSDWLRGALMYESQVRGMFRDARPFARALARRTGAPRRCTWTYWVRDPA
ncbi:PIG-L deacetylase family protein [Streptomyces sp. NPDC101490]|uniref:PIG-L deacetylase family protein n=1 Tax=Streptomyces sp. NPDC101490 TaxID=3366143 RepID=UPI00382BC2EB